MTLDKIAADLGTGTLDWSAPVVRALGPESKDWALGVLASAPGPLAQSREGLPDERT